MGLFDHLFHVESISITISELNCRDEKDAVVLQMAEMKNHYAEQMKTMEAEEDQSQQRMIASSKKMEERFAQVIRREKER